MASETHIIAIVKGAAEGDAERHFGSLLGFATHLADATRIGLVQADGPYDVVLTDAGRLFYDEQSLAELPSGRANQWPTDGALGAIRVAAEDRLRELMEGGCPS